MIKANYSDDVRGTIIGGDFVRYEFWTSKNSGYPTYLPPYKITSGIFRDDRDAENWVKRTYPDLYKAGIELRAFDR